ncbi:MAG: hypothetical protein F4142_06900 [Nitrospira sp. SB0675_bin_23]|nr:hypothetical protein [Nitrospira sp. SB0661_bin_20]MYH02291.1 hypothetical protein [Nitrospira sp. SB0675_bin_23]
MSGKIFLVNLSLAMMVGCLSVSQEMPQDSSTHELAFGYVRVETKGPHPRMYPARLRFFFLTNEESGERSRVNVNTESGVFSTKLRQGRYVVDRLQFSEGPFRVESHVQLTFHVPEKKLVYLGSWHIELETPRTIRGVKIRILEGETDFSKKFSAELGLERTPIVTVLPKPETLETRGFMVDGQPNARYFRRR